MFHINQRIEYKMTLSGKTLFFLLALSFSIAFGFDNSSALSQQKEIQEGDDIPLDFPDSSSKPLTIRNTNGKLYAYIVFLFMDNQHFVNMIQEGSIPNNVALTDDFKIKAYKNYLASIKTSPFSPIATSMLDIYTNFSHFTQKDIEDIERALENKNIVLKIIPYENKTPHGKSPAKMQFLSGRPTLGYCIYGQKTPIKIKHPLFEFDEKIYNIQPFIYYDEFATSNSTFYFDMIYINPEEVQTDYIIARNVLQNRAIDKSLMFVGANINDDIKGCLRKSFPNPQTVRQEIWKMFVIHEMTHKILNNHYNFYDQVIGEEMALSSTIYTNPNLGLAVMYSYLDYNAMNPHRIAALNYLRFVAQETSNKKIADDPSLVRHLSDQEIQRLTKLHFNSLRRILK
jgi:hypothetical protein